jgi:hypothetical protein
MTIEVGECLGVECVPLAHIGQEIAIPYLARWIATPVGEVIIEEDQFILEGVEKG